MQRQCSGNEFVSSRRDFLEQFGLGLGAVAFSQLSGGTGLAADDQETGLGVTHFPARAKRVIFLFQSGGPSQM